VHNSTLDRISISVIHTAGMIQIVLHES
jgi:hypothetical protein